MQQVNDLIKKYFSKLHIPSIIWTDVVEVFIIAFLLYHIMLWIKNTRAWALLKGLLVIGAFVLIAVFFIHIRKKITEIMLLLIPAIPGPNNRGLHSRKWMLAMRWVSTRFFVKKSGSEAGESHLLLMQFQ